MRAQAWSVSEIGLVRKSNQDAVGCFPDLSLFIVADGMGGHADGEIAAQTALAGVHEAFEGPASASEGWLAWLDRLLGRPRQAAVDFDPRSLEAAVKSANQRVLKLARANGDHVVMGTTLVVLKLLAQHAYWAHVGDSRLYRMRDGELRLLTADHTAHGEPYQGQADIPLDLPHSNLLSQAIGIRPDIRVSTGSCDVRPGDLFLLCSDGVFGMIDAAAMSTEMSGLREVEAIGRSLLERALAAGGRDNASLVVVRVDGV